MTLFFGFAKGCFRYKFKFTIKYFGFRYKVFKTSRISLVLGRSLRSEIKWEVELKMLKTNLDYLVKIGVIGEISQPRKPSVYRIDTEGKAIPLPGTGGITYNWSIGDNCMNLVGDHVEPGVSMKLDDAGKNSGLNALACVGNEAKVVSGDAKGALGYVTGTHGGIEHVMVYFAQKDLENMAIGDKIMVKSFGMGLQIEDAPQVMVKNLDPNLLAKMNLNVVDGVLEIPVVTEVPAHLMGSGIGAATADTGDYDIMTHDAESFAACNLGALRFGDLVLLRDCDTSYGRGYLKGAVTVGVVVHSNCVIMGHGPGITTLFTSKTGKIKGVKTAEANIAHYLGVRDDL